MPNRILRDWTTSEAIDSLTPEQECTFTRILMAVDDFGRFEADPRLLAARLYPLRICKASAQQMQSTCDALARQGIIKLYQVEGRKYLQIVKWHNVPRAKTSKFPAMLDTCTAHAQHMHSICSASAPVTVTVTEDRNREPEPMTEDSSEAEIPPSEPSAVALWFDCTGQPDKWPLTESQVDEWQGLYTGIDVLAECKHARAWENANPGKRKTFQGHARFLVSWLKRQQDSGKGRRNSPDTKEDPNALF